MKSTAIPQLMSVAEIARMLNVRPSWVYAKVASKEIPHLHVGRYPRFVCEDVIAWLRSGNGHA